MDAPLPTAAELEKLSLRAVVAYGVRTARRLSSELRGIIADPILNDALALVDSVSTAEPIGAVDGAAVVRAAARVAGAYADAPHALKSRERLLIVFSVVQAALAAMRALEVSSGGGSARHHMRRAAQAAERAVDPIRALAGGAASAAKRAARRDYEILLREYGKHDEVVIGDPVDCFPVARGQAEG